MQYLYELRFSIQGRPSEQLTNFVNASWANIVLPQYTVGGNMSSNINNFRQLTIRFPSLRKHVTFSCSDDAEVLKCNMVVYNLACSLASFFFVHTISADDKQLVVQMASDSKKDMELLKATYQRFEEIKEKKEKTQKQETTSPT